MGVRLGAGSESYDGKGCWKTVGAKEAALEEDGWTDGL